jgi:S1-C subfamily serine protease
MNPARVAIALLLVLLLAGCGVKQVPVAEPLVIEVPDGKDTRTLSVGRVVARIPSGKPVYRGLGGLACVKAIQDMPLPGGKFARSTSEAVIQAVYDELKDANYNVLGDPKALFNEGEDGMAELVLSGAVKDLWAEVCLPTSSWGNNSNGSGNATAEVEWQLYNRHEKRVLFKKTTKGASNYTFENDADPLNYLFAHAVANSLREVLADKAFHDLLALEPEAASDPQGVSGAPSSLKPQALGVGVQGDSSPKSPARPIAEVPRSVVTIQEGSSHGSGFLLTDDGYIVTNQHVVGNLSRARILFQDGRKVDGKVVARDVKRDAALIKIDPPGVPPLKVNVADQAVGSDVYAVGAPKSLKYAGTLTKGVVSAYRHFNGVRWIQADAAINPGNSGGPLVDSKGRVVGITTLSRVDAQGIFFFGPIGDVLDSLGVAVK